MDMRDDESRPILQLRSGDSDRLGAVQRLAARADALPATAIPLHDARELAEGGSVAQINLDGTAYTLRITRNGKLILTK
jgi:hemin uptake protein HemP